VSEVTDIITTFFSIVLAGATIALAWYTSKLVKLMKGVNHATQTENIVPSLTFDRADPLANGGGYYFRLAVKNVGLAPARYSDFKARLKTGKELRFMPQSGIRIIEVNSPYFWDIYGAKAGEELEIEVPYTDLKYESYQTFKHSMTAR
jgi:hypothetical protein